MDIPLPVNESCVHTIYMAGVRLEMVDRYINSWFSGGGYIPEVKDIETLYKIADAVIKQYAE